MGRRTSEIAAPAGRGARSAALLLPLLLLIGGGSSFNLETRHLLDKHGLPGSYFGYSVAGHSQRVGSGTGNTTNWMLVGAPLGQNLQPGSNHSGALFRCPITLAPSDCTQVITDGHRTPTGKYLPFRDAYSKSDDIDDEDGTGDSDSLHRLEPPGKDEIKNNQWLGVTVETGGQENKIFVCAHRYIKINNPQSLAYAPSGPGSTGLYLGQGVCYVLNEDFSFGFAVEVCRGRSIEREHQQYAFCQSGTSGAVLPDGTALIGTPGAMTWKGTLFNVAIEGGFLSRDKFQYFAPHDNLHSPVPNYSYLGMSVTGGRFFGEYMAYAGGAPRAAQGNGEVVIFSNRFKKNPFEHVVSLRGEQFGSGFGSTLASADVNGDGRPDLLVGAPNYFNRTDGGAVYVYLNRGNSFVQEYDQRLTGRLESRFGTAIANCGDLNHDGLDDVAIGAPYESSGTGRVYIHFGTKDGALSPEPVQTIDPADLFTTSWRTFGSSLAGGHDLDGNSYPDLIIGSYASDRVVALFARPIINIRTYEEQQPGEPVSIDPTRLGCASDPSANVTCFTFRACSAVDDASLNDGEVMADSTLQLRSTIQAETFFNERKFSRVYFGNGPLPAAANSNQTGKGAVARTNIFRRRFRLAVSGKPVCHEVTAYLKEGTRDIQNPIQFRISYTLDEEREHARGGGRARSRMERDLPLLEPILNRTAAERTFTMPFQKDCGVDGICRSALVIRNASLVGLARGSDANQLTVGLDRTLTLALNVQNKADSAYETHLYVVHDASLTYAGSKGSSVCGAHNATVVDCSIGNPMKRNGEVQLSLRFDARSLEEYGYSNGPNGISHYVGLAVFVNTTSQDTTGSKTRTALKLHILRMAKLSISGKALPEQVFYGGGGAEVKGESAIHSLEEIGMPVEHKYQIYNDGPWRAPFVRLEIDWPLQVANNKPQGKWLLYLDALPMLDMSGIMGEGRSPCEVLPISESDGGAVVPGSAASLVNPLGLLDRSAGSSYARSTMRSDFSQMRAPRVRRDRAMVLRPQTSDGAVGMDCASQTAKCVRIVCKIHDLGPKAHALVTVTARLWNATLVSDYAGVDMVRIGSSARFTVEGLDEVTDQPALPSSLTVRTEAFPEMGPPIVAMDVPWWIIILAAIAGLLVLIAFTYILYRCGFFRRKRHTGEDPTLSGNLERRRDPAGGGAYDELNDTNGSGGGTAERKPFLGRRS
ncbi:integrin alpha-PS1 isoform X1 [Anopheles stephensi]|uniref:integrin alpha-PS1 isoform X1 n=1 Tax=Anopheles stephensi TaxID=30069 RepID=UPI001658B374|nr:integrin alpha-PS1 isoform X1 [Anopheles stephensi]